jgi:regulator of protease activity HflC (stomatin/prohibitin superfamily)
MNRARWIARGLWAAVIVGVGFGAWQWVVCRTYVPEGQSLLVMYKGSFFGKSPSAPEGSFVELDSAGRPMQAGFLEQLRGPGRHFINPLFYKVDRIPDVVIDVGQIGVVTCKLGNETAVAGDFLVEGEVGKTKARGVLRKPLGPGRYRINLYGYDVAVYNDEGDVVETITLASAGQSKSKPAAAASKAPQPSTTASRPKNQRSDLKLAKRAGWLRIPAGYVGVLTNLAPIPAGEGQAQASAGIQDNILQPGYYLVNPFAQRVDIVEVGFRELSLKTELVMQGNLIKVDENGEPIIKPGGKQGINFPSRDGFPIALDFTAIWGVMPEHAPKVVRDFGDIEAVEKTRILPDIGNICRMEGSKHPAVELLTGKSREAFQDQVGEEFAKMLKSKNISLQVGLIRHIHIPTPIRAPLQKANIADEAKLTNDMEAVTTETEGQLEKARAEVLREAKRVVVDTEKQVQELLAEGRKEAELIRADAEVEVASVDRKAAELDAQATILLGSAQASVDRLMREAESSKFKLAIDAFGSSEAYNQYIFAKNLPEDLRLTMMYAGPGTFWTDLKSMNDAASAKVLQPKPAPPTTAAKE